MRDLINMIRDRSTIVGFTARRTGKASRDDTETVQDNTSRSLSQLGIRFSDIPNVRFNIDAQTINNQNLRPFDEPDVLMVHNNVCYCCTIEKDLVIHHLLDHITKIGLRFTKIVMIDDNKNNLDRMSEKMTFVEFVPIWYNPN
jgi:hypothetical protein